MLRGVLACLNILKFDYGSFIKILSTKIEIMFPLNMVRFYPARSCNHLCRVKTHQLKELRRLFCTNICENSNATLTRIALTSHLGNCLAAEISKLKKIILV